MIHITTVASDRDVHGILALQQRNLKKNLPPEVIASQGFVTLEHTFDVLRRMNDAEPSIIAKDGDTVVGYALSMLPAFKDDFPLLEGLFIAIDEIDYDGRRLSAYNYMVVGQLCVGEGYRGQGLVDRMYAHYRHCLSDRYDLALTDVSSANPRSIKAHLKVGFQVVKTFFDPHAQENWEVVVWDWRER